MVCGTKLNPFSIHKESNAKLAKDNPWDEREWTWTPELMNHRLAPYPHCQWGSLILKDKAEQWTSIANAILNLQKVREREKERERAWTHTQRTIVLGFEPPSLTLKRSVVTIRPAAHHQLLGEEGEVILYVKPKEEYTKSSVQYWVFIVQCTI